MSITTKLARRYNCEQVMPVPVMKRKLLCEQCPAQCTISTTMTTSMIAPITTIASMTTSNAPITEYSSDAHVLPGSIVTYTLTSIPDGYYVCDGSNVSRTVDSVLFQAIGTFYGSGDGSTTFGLPNLINGEQNHYLIKR
jgi:hypothetical protein